MFIFFVKTISNEQIRYRGYSNLTGTTPLFTISNGIQVNGTIFLMPSSDVTNATVLPL
jgi:hypothetical protein